jgi:urease beta subunit
VQPRNYLARVDAAAGAATTWDPNANGIVYAVALGGSGVYAGGAFTFIGGQTRNGIAALNAGDGTAIAWDPNANATVHALVVGGTRVYAGGDFTNINGLEQSYVAALSDPATVDVPAAPRTSAFNLSSAPNPARAHAEFNFALPTEGLVSLVVFDCAGRRVATLLDHAPMAAGPHGVALPSEPLATGVYFARLEFGSALASRLATHKFVIAR